MLTQIDLNLASMQKCQPITYFHPKRNFELKGLCDVGSSHGGATAFSITTLSIMKFNIMTLYMMTFNIMTLSIKGLIMTLSFNNIQY
jgi:hypothetical protein